jgi:hypothetical protein
MLRPVHAVGRHFHHGESDRREIDSRRLPEGWNTAESIHRVHLQLEAVQKAAPLALAAEPRLTAVQMCQGAGEHALHEIRGATLIGMGQLIACRRRDPKHGYRPAVETQPVADIIEAEGVRQSRQHHRRQTAPDGVGAGMVIQPMLPGGGLDDLLRNILEKLPQHIDMMAWWLG